MGTKMLETSTIDKDQQDPRREFIDRTPENPLLPSNLYTCTGTGYYFCVSNYLYNFILLKYLIWQYIFWKYLNISWTYLNMSWQYLNVVSKVSWNYLKVFWMYLKVFWNVLNISESIVNVSEIIVKVYASKDVKVSWSLFKVAESSWRYPKSMWNILVNMSRRTLMNRSLTRKQTGQVQKNEMRVIPKKKEEYPFVSTRL